MDWLVNGAQWIQVILILCLILLSSSLREWNPGRRCSSTLTCFSSYSPRRNSWRCGRWLWPASSTAPSASPVSRPTRFVASTTYRVTCRWPRKRPWRSGYCGCRWCCPSRTTTTSTGARETSDRPRKAPRPRPGIQGIINKARRQRRSMPTVRGPQMRHKPTEFLPQRLFSFHFSSSFNHPSDNKRKSVQKLLIDQLIIDHWPIDQLIIDQLIIDQLIIDQLTNWSLTNWSLTNWPIDHWPIDHWPIDQLIIDQWPIDHWSLIIDQLIIAFGENFVFVRKCSKIVKDFFKKSHSTGKFPLH